MFSVQHPTAYVEFDSTVGTGQAAVLVGNRTTRKKRRLRWRAEVNAGPRRLRNETGSVRESWKRIDESYRVQDRGGVKTSERDMSGRPGRK